MALLLLLFLFISMNYFVNEFIFILLQSDNYIEIGGHIKLDDD